MDPNKNSPNHDTPMETLLGGAEGGKYETVVSAYFGVFFAQNLQM